MVAIQVRGVPDGIRDDLAREAQMRGLSLQEYLRTVLDEEARRSRNRAFVRRWQPVRGADGDGVDVAELIHQQREERDQAILGADGSR